jgi:hypothetical protein
MQSLAYRYRQLTDVFRQHREVSAWHDDVFDIL